MTTEVSGLLALISFFQAVIILLLGWNIRVAIGLRKEMAAVSERVGRLETWAEMHEKHDDQRFKDISIRLE